MAEKYFVERVKYLKNGTFKKSEQMEYDSQKEAEKKFYTNVSTDLGDDTLWGSMCLVINQIGGQIDCKFWKDDDADIEPRYFVARVKTQKDGQIKKSELMDYATEQEAEAKMYTNIGTDMDDDTLQGSMCTVFDFAGNEIERKYWETNSAE